MLSLPLDLVTRVGWGRVFNEGILIVAAGVSASHVVTQRQKQKDELPDFTPWSKLYFLITQKTEEKKTKALSKHAHLKKYLGRNKLFVFFLTSPV
jgi:hypothetical protein